MFQDLVAPPSASDVRPEIYIDWGPESNVVAIVQARMDSRRLPGKVVKAIGGHSILEHVVHRLRKAPVLDGIVVATTHRDEDDRIAEECATLKVPVVRGSQDDVLDRYLEAADTYRADVIVRATADNPMIDPGSVDRAVRTLMAFRCDYVCERDLPKGCCGEVVTYGALRRAAGWQLRPEHREHVTLIMKERLDLFKVELPRVLGPLARPEVNLSVDTEVEYLFVKRAMERSSHNVLESSLPEVLIAITEMKKETVMADSYLRHRPRREKVY